LKNQDLNMRRSPHYNVHCMAIGIALGTNLEGCKDSLRGSTSTEEISRL
jgi:hypothetical protein